ncbi:tRNA (guanosine(37)-N1)-methyltransferase TrmD [Alterisphingorhabdus coralli]|uniref:tRNA (guanine-N(1)-)-methyltransferase n=1 Tax=Alterisphingorhabdus coralli TaxID=3071408 RepID=A0AA97F9N5_9SPHN|nr:tRNA (guanosine(37)-N1)-methyltransferase TrmD [Parasphingorhabdus sp. SCSIO 66989]WOE76543.1 tRNA (guanosine(37)-N1)-methyltransferase TrmD [Parasphingorhabdus sp. SCSIO 66989]
MTFHAQILTLYPEMFPGLLGASLAGKALEQGLWSCEAINMRDFATDRHRSVDDTPAGGGAGMVLRADILGKAVDFASARMAEKLPSPSGEGLGVGAFNKRGTETTAPTPTPPLKGRGYKAPVIALTPRGTPLTQARVREIASGPGVTLLCGRFEGFDERIFEARDIEEVSIGDYILSGGEVAATVLLDACIRLLPGVMGASCSGDDESFETGLLEYPHYTRPVEWEGRTIPEVLRSGDHAKIAAWREEQAEAITRLRRPDLWERHGGASGQSPSGAQRQKKENGK